MATYVSGMWLPVDVGRVSPDRQTYAFVVNSPNPVLHLVSVATGSDRYIDLSSASRAASAARTTPTPKAVLSFDNGGVFLETVVPNSDTAPTGLSLFDPNTGLYTDSVAAVPPDWTYVAVHNGLAYTGSAANGASSIPPIGPNPHWNEIMVINVNGRAFNGGLVEAGAQYLADSWLRIVGFDGGGQPVMSAESATSYRIYTGALFGSLPAPVFEGKSGDADNPVGPAVAQGGGLWFGSAAGAIWYYPGSGAPFERVAIAPFRPVIVAGPCS